MIRDDNNGKKYTLQDLRDMQKQSRESRQELLNLYGFKPRADADDFERRISERRDGEPIMPGEAERLNRAARRAGPSAGSPTPPNLATGPLWRAMEAQDPVRQPDGYVRRGDLDRLPDNCRVEYDSQGRPTVIMTVTGGGGGSSAAAYTFGGTAYPGGGGGGGGGGRSFGFGFAAQPQFPRIPPSAVRLWVDEPMPKPEPQPRGRFNNLDWEDS